MILAVFMVDPVLTSRCELEFERDISELCWFNHSELVNHTLTHLHRELQNLLEKNRRNFSSGVLRVEELEESRRGLANRILVAPWFIPGNEAWAVMCVR